MKKKSLENQIETQIENFIKNKEQALKARIHEETDWFINRFQQNQKCQSNASRYKKKSAEREYHERPTDASECRQQKIKKRKTKERHNKMPLLLKFIFSPFFLVYYTLFALYKTITFIGLISKYILLSPFIVIGFIVRKITEFIRMSLSFKITFIFSLVFILFTLIYHLLIGVLINTVTLSDYINISDSIFISAILSVLFGLFIMVSIGVKVAQKVLRPIERMTEDIKEISSNSLEKRLNVSTAKDELKDLSISFNGMLDELHEMYDKQSMFVSDASHELRTPIAVIQGYASMLDRWGKNDPEVLAESLIAIKTESESMKELVEKLLFLARADKNRIVLDKEFFDIHELMTDITKETVMIAPQHTIQSQLEFDGQLFGDQNSIKQALRVFIDNSIKYTPDGGLVSILLYKEENNVIIGIGDTGNGIPNEDIPHIFDRFYRADKSRTKETGGNGLGLSIAKWILDQHHCDISVSSTINVGTRVEITFKYI